MRRIQKEPQGWEPWNDGPASDDGEKESYVPGITMLLHVCDNILFLQLRPMEHAIFPKKCYINQESIKIQEIIYKMYMYICIHFSSKVTF